jgi:hypothetical protein
MVKSYAQLRERWAFEISGSDPSAIESQLLSMTWDFASYEVLAKSLQLAPAEPNGSIQRSGLLFKLLERSFSHRVLLFVRRMVDSSADSISLVRTLDEMERHRGSMTRAAIIAADGLEYDYEPIRREFYDWLGTQGHGAFNEPERLNWERHAERHAFIDRLTNVNEHHRSTSDVVPKGFFANLANRVRSAGASAKTYVDGHLAHAAKPQSRALKGADQIALTFSDLRKSLQTFCEVVSLVKQTILWQSIMQWLAIPLDDQFAYLEQPLASRSQLGDLQSVWNAIEVETQSWASWSLEDYQREFTAAAT